MTLIDYIDRRAYPDFASNWDDSLFRQRILRHLTSNAHVLEIGAGAGIVAQMNFRGLVGHVTGIDPDPRVGCNKHLDEAFVGFAETMPFAGEAFDVVFCNNVLEHITDPDGLLREVGRVLRPSGIFLAKTPNRRHYVPLLARATPLWFHRFVNRLRGTRRAEDTYPTVYGLNTPDDVHRHAARWGFTVEEIELHEGRPEYLRIFTFTYLIGLTYERLVNAFPMFRRYRVLMILTLRKR